MSTWAKLTLEFEPQTEDLNELDLWNSWECLERMEREGERWMAFYNCGEVSGARYPLSTPPLTPVNDINTFNSSHFQTEKTFPLFRTVWTLKVKKTTRQSPFNISLVHFQPINNPHHCIERIYVSYGIWDESTPRAMCRITLSWRVNGYSFLLGQKTIILAKNTHLASTVPVWLVSYSRNRKRKLPFSNESGPLPSSPM